MGQGKLEQGSSLEQCDIHSGNDMPWRGSIKIRETASLGFSRCSLVCRFFIITAFH
jgi:hypothetical protein